LLLSAVGSPEGGGAVPFSGCWQPVIHPADLL